MKICELEGYFPNRGAVNFGVDEIIVKILVPAIYKSEVYKWLQVSDHVVKINVSLNEDGGTSKR